AASAAAAAAASASGVAHTVLPGVRVTTGAAFGSAGRGLPAQPASTPAPTTSASQRSGSLGKRGAGRWAGAVGCEGWRSGRQGSVMAAGRVAERVGRR
ncbi:hypothetical protein D621_21065, partial [beta proteobacterium AAP51]